MTANILRALAIAIAGLIVILSLVPPSLRPVTAAPHDFEHFAIFLLCGLCLGLGYRSGHLLQGGALVIFAAVVEVLQRLIPGRHARLGDFLIDAAAACAGVCLAWTVLKMPRRAAADRRTLPPDTGNQA
jgi:VanZ family protein